MKQPDAHEDALPKKPHQFAQTVSAAINSIAERSFLRGHKYESSMVTAPRFRRLGRIVFGIAYISMGLLFLAAGYVFGPGYDKSEAFVSGCHYFGTLALISGTAYLVWAIRLTRESQFTNAGAAAKAADDAATKAREAKTHDAITKALTAVGNIVGALVALVIFIAVYVAAVDSVGWVIGIALGWIPAYLAATIVVLVFRGRLLFLLVAILIVWSFHKGL